jgi:hypothetical protein
MAEINPMVPVSALRAIAVEAIRSVTGCPDVSGNGKHLTDEIEAVARAAAESLRTTSQPVGVPEAAVHKNHLFDLRYTLDVLHKVRGLIGDMDQAHAELGAAITSMRYVIERTEAMASPASIPPHVMEILRSIHRRPSDCGIWLDDITMILRDVTACHTPPVAQSSGFQAALDIRTAQGWTLTGKAIPVLYTDTVNGRQVMRDDLWLATTDALKSAAPTAAGDEADWDAPTTYLQRFGDAMQCLCGVRPADEMLTSWLDKNVDDDRLQRFAIEHGPAWAQGIAIIDAARLMADQPTEGVSHEMLEDLSTHPAAPARLHDDELRDIARELQDEILTCGLDQQVLMRGMRKALDAATRLAADEAEAGKVGG